MEKWEFAMMSGYRRVAAGIGVLLLSATGAWADAPPSPKDQIDVGIFTAVEGKVAVTHPGLEKSVSVKIQDGVLFKDVIETDKESRTKALLNDDSILTVGEHSRVEITEHIYDPSKGVRSVVLNLVKGQVRALVGKAFTGSGSKFEIHTPTAVAAARGTYFIVFHINGVSGISNIGTHGHVDFASGGRSVPVPPGQFSVTPPGGGPPSTPAVNTGSGVPSQVASAVKGTEVKDSPKEESPKQMALASGGTAPVTSPSSLTPPGISGPGGSSQGSGGGGSSPSSGPTSPTVAGATAPTVIIPAVTSGAAPPPLPPGEPTPLAPTPPPVVVIPPTEPPPDVDDGDDDGTTPLPTKFQKWLDKFNSRIVRLFSRFDDRVEKGGPSLDEHARNLLKHVNQAGDRYLQKLTKAGASVGILTAAQSAIDSQIQEAVKRVQTAGFAVVVDEHGRTTVVRTTPQNTTSLTTTLAIQQELLRKVQEEQLRKIQQEELLRKVQEEQLRKIQEEEARNRTASGKK